MVPPYRVACSPRILTQRRLQVLGRIYTKVRGATHIVFLLSLSLYTLVDLFGGRRLWFSSGLLAQFQANQRSKMNVTLLIGRTPIRTLCRPLLWHNDMHDTSGILFDFFLSKDHLCSSPFGKDQSDRQGQHTRARSHQLLQPVGCRGTAKGAAKLSYTRLDCYGIIP